MILNKFLFANGAVECHFGEFSLFLLLCADDLVSFSESVECLQNLVDNLRVYAYKWHLSVNTDKTRIVFLVFLEMGAK